MTQEDVKQALMNIIQEIQAKLEHECPPLDGETSPLKDIPKFDSKLGVLATARLAQKLEVDIPHKENIFVDEKTKAKLSLDAIAVKVCAIAKPLSGKEQAA